MEIKLGDKIEIIEEVRGLKMKDNNGDLWVFAHGKWFKEVKAEENVKGKMI